MAGRFKIKPAGQVNAVPHKRPEPRRKVQRVVRLSRDDRIRKAEEIINKNRGDNGGGSTCADSCANLLDWLEWMYIGVEGLRSYKKETARPAVKQAAAWLRKGRILLNNGVLNAPEEFQTRLRQLTNQYDAQEKSKWVVLKQSSHPDVRKKRIASEAALHLCDEFKIKTTKTKRGALCRLAAVLYGDEGADLQKHCIVVLASNYRTFLARKIKVRVLK